MCPKRCFVSGVLGRPPCHGSNACRGGPASKMQVPQGQVVSEAAAMSATRRLLATSLQGQGLFG